MTDQPTDQPIGLTLDQAAVALGISREAVRLRLRRGTLDGIRNGREWCVYLAGRSVDPVAQPTTTTDRPTDHAQRLRGGRQAAARDREIMRLEETVGILRSEVDFLRRLTEHQAGQLADLARHTPELPASPPPGLDGLITALQESATVAPQRRAWWRRLLGRA